MSWREILGVITPSTESPYTHNSHNTQKPTEQGNCAYSANCAYGESEQEPSLLEALAAACQGLDITPAEVAEALADEDIDDWRKGAVGIDTLAAFARSLVERRRMDRGERPAHYTERATCRHCGPIWLWFAGEVLACPWCWNRLVGRPIPRPPPIT